MVEQVKDHLVAIGIFSICLRIPPGPVKFYGFCFGGFIATQTGKKKKASGNRRKDLSIVVFFIEKRNSVSLKNEQGLNKLD